MQVMGIAAYNRGLAAISEQISREIAGKHGNPPINVHYWLAEDLKPLRDRIAYLEGELLRARFCVARLRATQAVEREESRSRLEHMKGLAVSYFKNSQKYREGWARAGRLVRTLLSPEQVDDYRNEYDSDVRI